MRMSICKMMKKVFVLGLMDSLKYFFVKQMLEPQLLPVVVRLLSIFLHQTVCCKDLLLLRVGVVDWRVVMIILPSPHSRHSVYGCKFPSLWYVRWDLLSPPFPAQEPSILDADLSKSLICSFIPFGSFRSSNQRALGRVIPALRMGPPNQRGNE